MTSHCLFSGFDEPSSQQQCNTTSHEMNDHFKASVVAFEVQKSFANKFFSNKTVAKSLIDDTSARLLDNLYLLLKVFVSILFGGASNERYFHVHCKEISISVFPEKELRGFSPNFHKTEAPASNLVALHQFPHSYHHYYLLPPPIYSVFSSSSKSLIVNGLSIIPYRLNESYHILLKIVILSNR
jgi:hypothetical protein